MNPSLVWRCITCGCCRRFESKILPKRISHGKRLLGHCRACGEMRILRFEGVGSDEPLSRQSTRQPTRQVVRSA